MTTITDTVLRCFDDLVLRAEREERGTSIIPAQKERDAVQDIAYLTRDFVAREMREPRLTKPLSVASWSEDKSRRNYDKIIRHDIILNHGILMVCRKEGEYDDGAFIEHKKEEIPYVDFSNKEEQNPTMSLTFAGSFRAAKQLGDSKYLNFLEEFKACYPTHFAEINDAAKRMRRKLEEPHSDIENIAEKVKQQLTAAVVSYYQRTGLFVPVEGIPVGHVSYPSELHERFPGFPLKKEEKSVRLYPNGMLGVRIDFPEVNEWQYIPVHELKEFMVRRYNKMAENTSVELRGTYLKTVQHFQRIEISPLQFDNSYDQLRHYFTRTFAGLTPADQR